MHTPTFQLRFNAKPSVDSPRYRTHGEAYVVCWIVRPTIEVAKNAEAHYLVLNESVGDPDSDLYDLEFWNAERRAVALERATVAVGEAGWQLAGVKGVGPIDWLTADPARRNIRACLSVDTRGGAGASSPRVRDVFPANRSEGMRVLGWVTGGRRDIYVCGWLPPRLSLRRAVGRHRGNSAREFGAPAQGQWPPWAVRRYLLYSTLLHELGHLQRHSGRFASESYANRFANAIRRELYGEWLEHPDPVHNRPSFSELACIEVWERLDKPGRRRLVDLVLDAPHDRVDLVWLEPLTGPQRFFLRRALLGTPVAPPIVSEPPDLHAALSW